MRSKRALLLRSISKFLSILVRRKRKREMEKSFDLTETKILDTSLFALRRVTRIRKILLFFRKEGGEGVKLTIEEIRWRSKCY